LGHDSLKFAPASSSFSSSCLVGPELIWLSASDLQSLGATPHIHSLESATVSALVSLLTTTSPDAVVFAAGAGGKGGKERSRAVDYEGAVKVFDAMESANVKRLLLVGGQDVRTREKGWPDWYDEGSSECEGSWDVRDLGR